MDDEARLDALRRVRFFSHCSDRQLLDIVHLSEERVVEPGAELCRQGEFDQEAFVLLDGEADVIVDGVETGKVEPGEVVGELSMLGTGRRTATMRAIGSVRLLVLDPREIDSVLAANPSAARDLGHHPDPPGTA